jgi:adenylate cyclase
MKPAFTKFANRMRQLSRRLRGGFLISATVCVISLGLYMALYLAVDRNPMLQFLADIELRTLDMRFRLRGPRQPGPAVVIVAIDQKSQDVLGKWPFARRHWAEAMDYLREAQAKVIAFDINFPQPDENSALQALRVVKKQYDASALRVEKDPHFEHELSSLQEDADNDQKFEDALSRFPDAVLGYFFLPASETGEQDQALVDEFLNFLSFQAYPQVVTDPPDHPEFIEKYEGPIFHGLSPNLPRFALYAKNFGFFNVLPDPDGVVRRAAAIIRFGDFFYPSLDIAAALAYTNYSLEQAAVIFNENGLWRIDFGEVAIPTDPHGFVQIDFHGRAGTFPTYSFADVVQRKLPPELFRDRLVLFGPTATGVGDMAVTPFQTEAYPGVEVHANFIDNILQGSFLRRGPRENLIDMAFIVLFSLGAGILLSVVPSVRATAVLIVFLGFFLWLAYYLFDTKRIWIAAFLPTATLTLNYAGIVSYRFFFEEREKKKMHGAFQQYVAPSVINQLLQQPDLLRLGGEEKVLTAMFADIRGFTSLSEGMSPSALVDLLNEYLSEMTEVIFRSWGTLDKYIGDAIMAFWGAPYPQPDHPERACHAALEMLETLAVLQKKWEAEGRPIMNIGIGVHTGPMLVGNMGSSHRFNFTIMGDNVNLASRLEGLNKQFGTRLIVSETTYQMVRDQVVARELDLIRVKGKTQPVTIYELVGRAGDGPLPRGVGGLPEWPLGDGHRAVWRIAPRVSRGWAHTCLHPALLGTHRGAPRGRVGRRVRHEEQVVRIASLPARNRFHPNGIRLKALSPGKPRAPMT